MITAGRRARLFRGRGRPLGSLRLILLVLVLLVAALGLGGRARRLGGSSGLGRRDRVRSFRAHRLRQVLLLLRLGGLGGLGLDLRLARGVGLEPSLDGGLLRRRGLRLGLLHLRLSRGLGLLLGARLRLRLGLRPACGFRLQLGLTRGVGLGVGAKVGLPGALGLLPGLSLSLKLGLGPRLGLRLSLSLSLSLQCLAAPGGLRLLFRLELGLMRGVGLGVSAKFGLLPGLRLSLSLGLRLRSLVAACGLGLLIGLELRLMRGVRLDAGAKLGLPGRLDLGVAGGQGLLGLLLRLQGLAAVGGVGLRPGLFRLLRGQPGVVRLGLLGAKLRLGLRESLSPSLRLGAGGRLLLGQHRLVRRGPVHGAVAFRPLLGRQLLGRLLLSGLLLGCLGGLLSRGRAGRRAEAKAGLPLALATIVAGALAPRRRRGCALEATLAPGVEAGSGLLPLGALLAPIGVLLRLVLVVVGAPFGLAGLLGGPVRALSVDLGAPGGPVGGLDRVSLTAQRGLVQRPGAGQVAAGVIGTPVDFVGRQHPPVAAIDHCQLVAVIGVGVLGILH